MSSTAEAMSLDFRGAGRCVEEREEALLVVLGVAVLPLECFCFCLADDRMMERMFCLGRRFEMTFCFFIVLILLLFFDCLS